MSKSIRVIVNDKTLIGGEWQCGIQVPTPEDDREGYWREDPYVIGVRYSMGLGHIFFEDAGTHIRVFRFSSRGNLNFYEDLSPDGTWHIGPHSAYREQDIDKEKAATETWYPWETHEDFINRLKKEVSTDGSTA